MGPGNDCTVAEGMRGNDDTLTQQSGQFARLSLHSALSKESLPPVLLSLTGEVRPPGLTFQLASEAGHDQRPRRPESPPVCLGPQRVHSTALRAAPAFHPYRLFQVVEVSRDITMPPQTWPPASGTSRWPWPGVMFALIQ